MLCVGNFSVFREKSVAENSLTQYLSKDEMESLESDIQMKKGLACLTLASIPGRLKYVF